MKNSFVVKPVVSTSMIVLTAIISTKTVRLLVLHHTGMINEIYREGLKHKSITIEKN